MTSRSTALITGATSGIGRAFARRLAHDGYTLILHGRRESELATLCGELRTRHGIAAEYVTAEFSDPDQLLRVEERIRQISDLDLLVNNAGFGTATTFELEDVAVLEAMVRTHLTAPVRLIRAALPGMLERRRGAIINVASVAGFLISHGSLYCATKAALINLSESLHLQVRSKGIRIQALCPGFTRSEFHQRMGVDTSGEFFRHFMSAEAVVDASLNALKRGKVVCIPGLSYKIAAAAPRFMPRAVMYAVTDMYRRRKGQQRGV